MANCKICQKPPTIKLEENGLCHKCDSSMKSFVISIGKSINEYNRNIEYIRDENEKIRETELIIKKVSFLNAYENYFYDWFGSICPKPSEFIRKCENTITELKQKIIDKNKRDEEELSKEIKKRSALRLKMFEEEERERCIIRKKIEEEAKGKNFNALITSNMILKAIERTVKYPDIFIKEVPINNRRIDAVIIKRDNRSIQGFEIKTSRGNYRQDNKFSLYAEYCTALTIVCPYMLLRPDEVKSPYGLAYVSVDNDNRFALEYIRKPELFRGPDSTKDLSWLHSYIKITDIAISRLYFIIKDKMRIPLLEENYSQNSDLDNIAFEDSAFSTIAFDVKYPDLCLGNIRLTKDKFEVIILRRPQRIIEGFKVFSTKEGYKNETNWIIYKEFCNNLTVVCPKGILKGFEVIKPFGLLYVWEDEIGMPTSRFVKNPKQHINNDSYSWLFIYIRMVDKIIDSLNEELQGNIQELKTSKDPDPGIAPDSSSAPSEQKKD